MASPILSLPPSPAKEVESDHESDKGSDQDSNFKSSSINPRPPLATDTKQQSSSWYTFLRQKPVPNNLDAVATQPSVYDDEEFSKHYAIHPQWENRHRFDVGLRWTWREERALIRKMDLRIALWAVIMFFCLDLDRENIAQANSDNMLNDLGITKNDYNLGNTLFKLAFLLAELPSQMISKRLGVDRWVPTQLVVWSAFSAAQFWMKGRATFLALRWMIGMLQGGFIPDVVLYLSYFYTSRELPLRLAFFWLSNYAVKIISPFLALGLLKLRGHGGHAGWQYLFLIEGLFTLIIGILSFANMPAGPCETKNWLWRTPWFTPREEAIIVTRALRDDPSKAAMHNRQGIDWANFKRSLFDYDLWPMYLIGLIYLLPSYPVSNYLTLQLRELHFSTSATNALSVPAPALGLVIMILVTIISEHLDNRSFVASSVAVWNTACYFALFALPANSNRWTYWAVASLQQAFPYVHALTVAWTSRQSGSIRTRTISAAIFNMFVQISAIIGANVYRQSDAPAYRRGNLAMALLSVATVGVFFLVFFYYRWRNTTRERKWSSMSKEEQLHYLSTTTDQGNRRLDFRFAT